MLAMAILDVTHHEDMSLHPNHDRESARDFRQSCYEVYVSARRGSSSPDDAQVPSPAHRRWMLRKYGAWLRAVPRDRPVLELGCGNGLFLRFLQEQGVADLTGVDISAEQVELAQASGIAAVQADAFSFLPSAPHKYAAVVALDFLEHFTRSELLDLLPLVHNALLPGGSFLVQTPNAAGLLSRQVVYGDITHMTALTPESLEQLLTMAGFEDVHFAETGPAPCGLKGRIRCLLWWTVRAVAAAVKRIESGKSQSLWTENMICWSRTPGGSAA